MPSVVRGGKGTSRLNIGRALPKLLSSRGEVDGSFHRGLVCHPPPDRPVLLQRMRQTPESEAKRHGYHDGPQDAEGLRQLVEEGVREGARGCERGAGDQ